jgi:hypothetical protein
LARLPGRADLFSRARIAFFIAAGVTVLVVAFLIVRHIANNNNGKVFGVQIGVRLDRQNSRNVRNVNGPLGVKTYRLPWPALTPDSDHVADILQVGDVP